MAGRHDLQKAVSPHQWGIELYKISVEATQQLRLVGRARPAQVAMPTLAVGLASSRSQHPEEAMACQTVHQRIDRIDQILGQPRGPGRLVLGRVKKVLGPGWQPLIAIDPIEFARTGKRTIDHSTNRQLQCLDPLGRKSLADDQIALILVLAQRFRRH